MMGRADGGPRWDDVQLASNKQSNQLRVQSNINKQLKKSDVTRPRLGWGGGGHLAGKILIVTRSIFSYNSASRTSPQGVQRRLPVIRQNKRKKRKQKVRGPYFLFGPPPSRSAPLKKIINFPLKFFPIKVRQTLRLLAGVKSRSRR